MALKGYQFKLDKDSNNLLNSLKTKTLTRSAIVRAGIKLYAEQQHKPNEVAAEAPKANETQATPIEAPATLPQPNQQHQQSEETAQPVNVIKEEVPACCAHCAIRGGMLCQNVCQSRFK